MSNALTENKIRKKHVQLCMYAPFPGKFAIMQKFNIAQGHFSSGNLVPHANDLKND